MAVFIRLGMLFVCSLCLMAGGAMDASCQEQGVKAPPTLEVLSALAEALDNNRFPEREQASARLREIALLHPSVVREPLVSIYKNSGRT